jgi:hypothetical protein
MTTPFVTTGVPTTSGPNGKTEIFHDRSILHHSTGFTDVLASGPVPIRREIRELQQNDPIQWNLFLLGLRALQTVDENDQLSFYQISGKLIDSALRSLLN